MANNITYEEALALVKNPAAINGYTVDFRSRAIRKYWTEEFIEAALNSGTALLSWIPKDKITQRMAEIGVYDSQFYLPPPDQIHYVPEKFLTEDFLLRAVSYNPFCFTYALRIQRKGRESEPYSNADILLCKEALCPCGWGNRFISNLRTQPEFSTEDDRTRFIMKEAPRFAPFIPDDLLYAALAALSKDNNSVSDADADEPPVETAMGETAEKENSSKIVIFRSEGKRYIEMVLCVGGFDNNFHATAREIVDLWYDTDEEFVSFVVEGLNQEGYRCTILECEFFDD